MIILCSPFMATAQNVGIGTNTPLRRLSVVGSLMVDQSSTNFGSLDSAALVFGGSGNSGISSKKVGVDQHNLTFWTNGAPYMSLSPSGNLGVGGEYGSLYRLWVRNGNSRMDGELYIGNDLTAQGIASIGGSPDP
ncbi:MAG TPA: hypothetical protein VFM90_13180, partial [Cyclobacteriaceae bacterium]|nr:hypothetical protein [Cyclobacteriaceae bacterium]